MSRFNEARADSPGKLRFRNASETSPVVLQ